MNNQTPENAETHLVVRLSGSDLKLLKLPYVDDGCPCAECEAIIAIRAAVERAETSCTCGDATIPDREHFYDGRTCHDLNFVAPNLREHTRVPVHPDDACADHGCALLHPGVNHATYVELCER